MRFRVWPRKSEWIKANFRLIYKTNPHAAIRKKLNLHNGAQNHPLRYGRVRYGKSLLPYAKLEIAPDLLTVGNDAAKRSGGVSVFVAGRFGEGWGRCC